MNGFLSILIYVSLFMLFIWLLPSLLWLFLIVMAVGFVVNLVRRIFFKDKYKKNVYTRTYTFDNSHIDDQPNYSSYQTQGRIDPDVIDVEYTEKDE